MMFQCLIPPVSTQAGKFLKDDGSWATPSGGGGGGTTVVANPTGSATETLEKLKVGDTIYQVSEDEDVTYLFKSGQWQNTNILQFATNGCTIADGKLKFLGASSGACVSDLTGLAGQGITSYNVVFKIVDVPSGGITPQAGRCYPTNDMYNIMQTGANRISYTNDQYSYGNDYIATVSSPANNQGVFFGAGYNNPSTNYSIEEIYLVTKKVVEKTYN